MTATIRAFVRDCSHRPPTIHNLTRKDVAFQWDSDCEEAFLELETRLTSAPIVVAPRVEGHYVLDTDASDTALGAVLQLART